MPTGDSYFEVATVEEADPLNALMAETEGMYLDVDLRRIQAREAAESRAHISNVSSAQAAQAQRAGLLHPGAAGKPGVSPVYDMAAGGKPSTAVAYDTAANVGGKSEYGEVGPAVSRNKSNYAVPPAKLEGSYGVVSGSSPSASAAASAQSSKAPTTATAAAAAAAPPAVNRQAKPAYDLAMGKNPDATYAAVGRPTTKAEYDRAAPDGNEPVYGEVAQAPTAAGKTGTLLGRTPGFERIAEKPLDVGPPTARTASVSAGYDGSLTKPKGGHYDGPHPMMSMVAPYDSPSQVLTSAQQGPPPRPPKTK